MKCFVFRPDSELDILSKKGSTKEVGEKLKDKDYVISHIDDIIPIDLTN